jgi:hypothetical protein
MQSWEGMTASPVAAADPHGYLYQRLSMPSTQVSELDQTFLAQTVRFLRSNETHSNEKIHTSLFNLSLVCQLANNDIALSNLVNLWRHVLFDANDVV